MTGAGYVLDGADRARAIDEHLAWLAGRMPSEIHKLAQREAEPAAPIAAFLNDRRARRPGRVKRAGR